MDGLTHLDTQVIVWLYIPRLDLLSARARVEIDEGDLAVSPMAVLELTYWNEVGRLAARGSDIFNSLREQVGLRVDETPFARIIDEAHAQTWTRDPFDRVIAAHALAAGASLVSADATLRGHVRRAVW